MRAKKKNCDVPIMNRMSIFSWGPCAWNFLHASSYAYPLYPTQENKSDMFNFLMHFAKVIPCTICSDDFVNYLREHLKEEVESLAFKNRKNLVEFIVDAHNYVNKKLNKRIFTYDEVDAMYLGQTQVNTIKLIVILALLILVVLHVLYQPFKTFRH